jgi:hypothetical protein
MSILVAGPANGSITLNLDGGFRYEPAANFAGTDTFSYAVLDANRVQSQTVTVTVKVVGAPQPPPVLTGVRASRQEILLSWSISSGDWKAQFAPTIQGPWADSSAEITTVNGQASMTEAIGTGDRFYRLVRR